MHLTFPGFSITQQLPEDGDLRLEIQPLTMQDMDQTDFTYGQDGDDHLDTFANRLNFLNRVHRGRVTTRNQSKCNVSTIRSCLQQTTKDKSADAPNFCDISPDNIQDAIDDRDDNWDFEPNYDVRDDGTQRHSDATRSYADVTNNTQRDIPDDFSDDDTILAGNKESDPEFRKDDRSAPSQYRMDSSRGAKKDRLTRYTLQSFLEGGNSKTTKCYPSSVQDSPSSTIKTKSQQ